MKTTILLLLLGSSLIFADTFDNSRGENRDKELKDRKSEIRDARKDTRLERVSFKRQEREKREEIKREKRKDRPERKPRNSSMR